MIGIGGRNVDFRWTKGSDGYPTIQKMLSSGCYLARCISLPEMEEGAAEYMAHGIRVIAVYTGESDQAGRYILKSCAALQIGNEPAFAYPNDQASWPNGTTDDVISVWSYIKTTLVPITHPEGLPLIGPGFWAQDYAKWGLVAPYLPGISAAAVHCYPGPSNQTPVSLGFALRSFRNIRPDLPLIGTECHLDTQPLAYARIIDTYCDARLWMGYSGAEVKQKTVSGFESNPAYSILALSRFL